MNLPSSLPCERWTVTTLAQWIVSVLTGGSPFSLFVVMTLIVLILGKLRGDDRY